jgi:hypothetical protein
MHQQAVHGPPNQGAKHVWLAKDVFHKKQTSNPNRRARYAPLTQGPPLLHALHTCRPLQTYTHLRNGLVALYRRQPERRLTLQDAMDTFDQYDPGVLERCAGPQAARGQRHSETPPHEDQQAGAPPLLQLLAAAAAAAASGRCCRVLLKAPSVTARSPAGPLNSPFLPTARPLPQPHRVFIFLESWGVINWLGLGTEPTPAAASLPAGTHLALSKAGQRPRLPQGLTITSRGAEGFNRVQRGAPPPRLLQLRNPTTAEGVAAACGGGTLLTLTREGRGNRSVRSQRRSNLPWLAW